MGRAWRDLEHSAKPDSEASVGPFVGQRTALPSWSHIASRSLDFWDSTNKNCVVKEFLSGS